jgi:hypothetical protein
VDLVSPRTRRHRHRRAARRRGRRGGERARAHATFAAGRQSWGMLDDRRPCGRQPTNVRTGAVPLSGTPSTVTHVPATPVDAAREGTCLTRVSGRSSTERARPLRRVRRRACVPNVSRHERGGRRRDLRSSRPSGKRTSRQSATALLMTCSMHRYRMSMHSRGPSDRPFVRAGASVRQRALDPRRPADPQLAAALVDMLDCGSVDV